MLDYKLALFILFTISWNFSSSEETGPLVTVTLGEIRGTYMKTLTGRSFAAFRGIPYAKPPTGQLRFKPPEKLTDPWTSEPLDATKDGAVCYQYDMLSRKVLGEEDCLVVNVYTPEIPEDVNKLTVKPVMVFIHGGGFNFGEGSSYFYGPRRLLDHDVILVTLNYRLNFLGFLSTGNEASPGNYGLLDQVEALKWIKENIHAFGGDPDKVTIFGESAGGASVSYHLLSGLSTGLFSAAIAMSGPVLAPWSYDDNPILLTKKLAVKVGCAKQTSQEIVDCLRETPINSFAIPIKEIGDKINAPFRPTLDRNFLTDHPLKLTKRGEIVNRVPVMVGITANEGVAFYGFFGNSIPEISDKSIQLSIAKAENIDEKLGGNVVDMVKERYFPDFDNYTPENFQKILIQLLGDSMMNSPFYYTLELYLENGIEPYVYSFDYVTNHSIADLLGLGDRFVETPTHADDLYFILDSSVFFPRDSERKNDDNENKFLEMFVNFAKNGNPNVEDDAKSEKWIPATKTNPQIYHLDNPLKLTRLKFDPELNDFWITQIPKSLRQENALKDEL